MTSNCLARVLAAISIAMLTACSATSVNQVWHDPTRASAPLGKVLVIAAAPQNSTAVALENEWVRQLKARGIDARAFQEIQPGERQPDKEQILALVKTNAIDTVLVTRIVDKKMVERDVAVNGGPTPSTPGYPNSWYDFYGAGRTFSSTGSYTVEHPVAVVQTNVYDAATEKLFWSAGSDTFLEGSANELIQGFVKAMIDEMAKSKLV